MALWVSQEGVARPLSLLADVCRAPEERTKADLINRQGLSRHRIGKLDLFRSQLRGQGKCYFLDKNTICSRPEPLTALEKIAKGTTNQRVTARTTMTSCDRTIPIVCQTAMWNAVMKMSAASILSIKSQHQHRRQQSHSNQVFKALVIRSSNNRTRVWYESTQTILIVKYIFEYYILLKCTVSGTFMFTSVQLYRFQRQIGLIKCS